MTQLSATVSTIIINVRGTTGVGLSSMGLTSLPSERKVVWNFYEATSVTLTSMGMHGSILAPLATISNPTGMFFFFFFYVFS